MIKHHLLDSLNAIWGKLVLPLYPFHITVDHFLLCEGQHSSILSKIPPGRRLNSCTH